MTDTLEHNPADFPRMLRRIRRQQRRKERQAEDRADAVRRAAAASRGGEKPRTWRDYVAGFFVLVLVLVVGGVVLLVTP